MSAMPEGDPPTLTVIIVTLIGGSALERCLASALTGATDCIVIGPHAQPGEYAAALTSGATIRWLPATATVPALRSQGLALARTQWVLIIEDTCELLGDWSTALRAATSVEGAAAVGASVRIDAALAPKFFALACAEYAEFAPRRFASQYGATTEVERLAGLCMALRIATLASTDAASVPIDVPLIETETFAQLRGKGGRLLISPDFSVCYFASDAIGATLHSRFTHGRIYGGGQTPGGVRRLLAVLKCAALPAVLTARSLSALNADSRSARVLAWIVGYACAWSLGELTGLLFGRGTALTGWRE